MSSVFDRYLRYAEYVLSLDAWEKFLLVKRIEKEFIEQCDTELGDFLNDYFLLILQDMDSECFELKLDQMLLNFDLNPEMMVCVADSLEEIQV
jgi:hypothetical protein